MQKIPGTVDFRDFQHASKTLWTEHKLRHAEPTSEGTLYQVRSEALSFWRTNLRPSALPPNEFNKTRLRELVPRDAHVAAVVRQGAVFDGVGRKFVDHHCNHDRVSGVQPH